MCLGNPVVANNKAYDVKIWFAVPRWEEEKQFSSFGLTYLSHPKRIVSVIHFCSGESFLVFPFSVHVHVHVVSARMAGYPFRFNYFWTLFRGAISPHCYWSRLLPAHCRGGAICFLPQRNVTGKLKAKQKINKLLYGARLKAKEIRQKFNHRRQSD